MISRTNEALWRDWKVVITEFVRGTSWATSVVFHTHYVDSVL